MNKWIVGGDDVLNRFTVSRRVRLGENVSARESVMNGDRVRVFNDRNKAQALADKWNKPPRKFQSIS